MFMSASHLERMIISIIFHYKYNLLSTLSSPNTLIYFQSEKQRELPNKNYDYDIFYVRGVKLIFTEGHFNIMAAIKGPVVTVRLYKRYHSLTYC